MPEWSGDRGDGQGEPVYTVVSAALTDKLADTSPGVNCGQCTQVCPVGAPSRDNTDEQTAGKIMVIQIGAVGAITLAESLGYRRAR